MARPGALPTSSPAQHSQAATPRTTPRRVLVKPQPPSQSQSQSIVSGGPQLPAPASRQGTTSTSSTGGHVAGSSRLGDVSHVLKRPLSRQAAPHNGSTRTVPATNASPPSDPATSAALPRTPPRAAARSNGLSTPSSTSSYASRQGSTSRSPAVQRGRDATAPPSSVAALARSLDLNSSATAGECSRQGGYPIGRAEGFANSLDHQRSLSVKSQISEGTTTDGGSSSGQDSLSFSANIRGRRATPAAVGMDVADTHSTLERRGSAASTVPTSPDVEPLPPLPWQQIKGGTLLGEKGEASSESPGFQVVPTYYSPSVAPDLFDASSSREGKELPTIDSVGDITHLSAASSASDWENRNKPLPAVVSAVTEATSASHVRASESSSRLTADSKTSNATNVSSKGAIRSAFSQGGKYLRSSPLWSQASSRQSSLSPSLGGASPMGSDLSQSSDPSASDLGHSDRNESSASLHPPPRSHSPFMFRKRSKPQLSASIDQPTQKAVPPTPSYFSLRKNPRQNSHASSSGASSDSKRATGSGAADASSASKSRPPSAASRASHTLDRSRSRFSQRMSINDTNWSRAPTPSSRSRDPSPPSSIRAHVAIEPLVPKRPPLMRRDRSRSLGEMDKLFKGGEQASVAGQLTVPDVTRASLSATSSPASQAIRDGDRDLAASLPPLTLPFVEATGPLFPTHDGVQESLRGTNSGAKKSHSFRWSRVLGKRGSISERSAGQPPEDNALARAKSSTSPRAANFGLEPFSLAGHSRGQRSPQHAKRPSIYDEGRIDMTSFPVTDKQHGSHSLPTSDGLDPAEESALGLTTTMSAESARDSQSSHAAQISPQLASLWSSAVGFDFAGRHGEEETSCYHDALSVPSSPPRPAPPLDTSAVSDAAEYTAPTPPSRRESLGRTLTTMFDPRPSLNGMVPELPRPAGDAPLPRSQSTTFALPQRHARTGSKSSIRNSSAISHSRHSSMAFNSASASTSATNSPITAKTSLSSSSLADRAPSTPTRRSGMDASASRQKMNGIPFRPPPPPPKVPSDPSPAVNGVRNASSSAPSPRNVTAPVSAAARDTGAPPAIRNASTPEAARRTRDGSGGVPSPRTPPSSTQTTPTKAGKKETKFGFKGNAPTAAAPPVTMRTRTKSSTPSSARSSESSAPLTGKTIPNRGSSQPGPRTRTVSQTASPVVHRRAKSKPALSIETSDKNEGMPRAKLARPSSALDMYRRDGQGTFAGKLNQPQVQELDDHAFLQLLEEARRQQKEKAAKRVEEADKMARLTSMGMAPTRKSRGTGTGDRSVSGGKSVGTGSHAGTGASSAGMPSLHRRSSSADGRLGDRPHRLELNGQMTRTDAQDEDDEHDEDDPHTPSSPVGHFSVGKASGQLNSAFANDDDWKREVRALFVIRELLNTEQSYARHLESLLLAVRRKAMTASSSLQAAPPRRKSVGGLGGVSAASSSLSSKSALASGGATDRHLPLMRNLLPQLIALSRSLSLRIDGNPTAAGVGSAFSIIAPQLEATFVAWSSAANEIMTSLRYTQGPKGKSKDKLVLAPVVDTDTSVFKSAVAQQQSSIARSQPASPKKSKSRMSIDALALTRPSSPIEPDVVTGSSGFSVPSSRTTKRRSTISSVTGVRVSPVVSNSKAAVAVGTSHASTISQSPSAIADEVAPVQPPSRPASPWGFAASTKRSIAAAAASASRPGAGLRSKKLSSSQSSMDISSVMSSGSNVGSTVSDGAGSSVSKATSKGASINGTGAAAANGVGAGPASSLGSATPQPQAKATKALSPLDVAIMPMQRPPRYLLLLTELVRNTPPESVSHARLVKGLEIVRTIARKCDEASGTGAGVPVGGAGGTKGGASVPSSAGPAATSFH